VKRIAYLLGFSYVEISPSAIASTYVQGTQGKIKAMFEDAAKKRPCLLFANGEAVNFLQLRQQSP
jgi:SpoVK/Ycf46/Vps4 family AAA+-type ATPase